jgi:hypothetical protein
LLTTVRESTFPENAFYPWSHFRTENRESTFPENALKKRQGFASRVCFTGLLIMGLLIMILGLAVFLGARAFACVIGLQVFGS